MKSRALLATLALLALPGCGGGSGGNTPAATPPSKPFEIDGAWIYLGPSDEPHILTVTDSSMVYTAVAGDWSSNWTIKAYDDDLHHFQAAFDAGTGTYVPVGASLSGAYDLNGTVLTVQVAQGLTSYPQVEDAGTCTAAADGTPVPDCRLYIKQN
ncbi:MAG TPA: hypothetical protein VMI54_20980 [Polyangiaceae bacterium]|nr:hypothetical protein [Polyangiaceae bacterium]